MMATEAEIQAAYTARLTAMKAEAAALEAMQRKVERAQAMDAMADTLEAETAPLRIGAHSVTLTSAEAANLASQLRTRAQSIRDGVELVAPSSPPA